MKENNYLEQYKNKIEAFKQALCTSFLLEVSLERYDEIVKFFKEHEKALNLLDDAIALGCKDIANKFLDVNDYVNPIDLVSYDPASNKRIDLLEVKRCMLDFYVMGTAYYIHNDILKEPLITVITKIESFKGYLIKERFSLTRDVLDLDSESNVVNKYLKLKELVDRVVEK